MDLPSCVYRLQMSRSFTLHDAVDLLPYLHDLGVDGVYCSPLFDAVTPGGYDITDPARIHPELGGREAFELFCAKLSEFKMVQILDVVPNHMGIRGKKNRWWLDVLEKGPTSPYACFFDIDWKPQKILLPILKEDFNSALEKGEITLVHEEDRFWIGYYDYRLPLCEGSDPKEEIRELLKKQYYRLSCWLNAGNEINYRRFFNINELVAICIECKRVFEKHHGFALELIQKGKAQVLRVDHPDGLYDPYSYFKRLRSSGVKLILAEKILNFQEALPEKWNVDGTAGYDFLNMMNGLFVKKENEGAMTKVYRDFTGQLEDFGEIVYEGRKAYIEKEMSSEIALLASMISQQATAKDFTGSDLRQALREIIANFPVYRTYMDPKIVQREKDKEYICLAISQAKVRAPLLPTSLFDFLQSLMLFDGESDEIHFVMRLQQVTAPSMAKGLEDRAFYCYNRLISLNEVGGFPYRFGTTPEEFHAFNRLKQQRWPYGLLASSTHDTKFSEDARMRLHVLSEIPDLWRSRALEWQAMNASLKTRIGNALFPDANAEYYLYQLLLALWPDSMEEASSQSFADRLWRCFYKALKEAGSHTSWRRTNEEYEQACLAFLRSLLSVKEPFFDLFCDFHQKIALAGEKNSISSVIMKMGSCGIVDQYQGSEGWRFCHVDPDNRASIDFEGCSKEKKKFPLVAKALAFRRAHKELFLEGDYLSLQVENERAVGWIRRKGSEVVLILAGRFFFNAGKWEGVAILPEDTSCNRFEDIFTGSIFSPHQSRVSLSEALGERPASIFWGKTDGNHP